MSRDIQGRVFTRSRWSAEARRTRLSHRLARTRRGARPPETARTRTASASIRAGDTVLAEDAHTGAIAGERVERVIDDGDKALMAVTLSDGSAITVTANHPFYVDSGAALVGSGWLQADELRVGDRLRTANGRGVTVVGLRRDAGRAEVYTLTVARAHTFFVGGTQVLAHNASDPSNCASRQAAKSGVQIHKTSADQRRASGEYDLVAAPIPDKAGNTIFVPKSVDLETGQPLPGVKYQDANPDAVSFSKGIIYDDKPLGRRISRDRQEMIRFITAYQQREGVLPNPIEIHWYDPTDGSPAGVKVYSPSDLLP